MRSLQKLVQGEAGGRMGINTATSTRDVTWHWTDDTNYIRWQTDSLTSRCDRFTIQLSQLYQCLLAGRLHSPRYRTCIHSASLPIYFYTCYAVVAREKNDSGRWRGLFADQWLARPITHQRLGLFCEPICFLPNQRGRRWRRIRR